MRVLLIHGWDGNPENCWFPWLKNELEERKFEVKVPSMPTNPPTMKDWVPHLAKTVGKPDENTYLVGHSVGCITILRYLEGLESFEKIGGAILAAGFSDNLGYSELQNFFERPINWSEIKKHCERFVAIHSDDDPDVPLKHGPVFKEKLGAELIVEHKKGHFSDDAGVKELPSALESILKFVTKKKS